MFATFPQTRNQRRGVVLILVLGMLGLLALIGVTFATFSGQVKVNSRNFSQAQNWPDSSELMDYALAQLIDDTDNPQSAIRGHSLKRDMYGNDAFYNSGLSGHPVSGAAFTITAAPTVAPAGTEVADPYNQGTTLNVAGLYMCVTNISTSDAAFYGYNFTRWVMKFQGQADSSLTPPRFNVGQTHEVLADDATGAYHVFYIAPWDGSYATPTAGLPAAMTNASQATLESPTYYSLAPTIPYPLKSAYENPYTTLAADKAVPYPYYQVEDTATEGQSTLIALPTGTAFTLDGRFLHAFNGPGMSGSDANLGSLPTTHTYLSNRGMSQYANYRFNGNIISNNYNVTNPLLTPYAYGFPNDISGMDEDYDACDLENWFLALQSGDSQVIIPSFHRPGILIYDTANSLDDWVGTSAFSASKILRPRNVDGHSSLAFRNLYPNKDGTITYDVDNDGDGTTDSVWLDLGYPPRRNSAGQLYKPLYAFMIIGLNGRIPLNTAGNLQLRDLRGTSLAMHSSGKGYSPSEIDPTYALQNAVGTGYTQNDNASDSGTPSLPGIPISLTQLRNLLAGTRSQDISTAIHSNDDNNFVLVDGLPWYVPNGVGDLGDNIGAATPPVTISTATTAIPGRWGEADQMPASLVSPSTISISMSPDRAYVWPNPIRAGLSGREMVSMVTPPVPPTGYGDSRDDNYNTNDVFPVDTTGATPNNNYATPVGITTLGENADFYDKSGSLSMAVERFRRFVTPIDVLGDGLINSYKSPAAVLPLTPTYLRGADDVGRVAYLKHFRPPGVAITTSPGIVLPYDGATSNYPAAPTPTTSPVFYPHDATVGWLSNLGKPSPTFPLPAVAPGSVPADRTTNLLHGYESFRNVAALAGVPQILLGAMHYNNSGIATPTFDQFINSSAMDITLATPPPTYLPSANLNEADEMQLYYPTSRDAPFGPGDLEWLYRQQDTDGVSLSSRLKDLAPVSFTNPKDGMRRRRLFSIETWEPTNFVWANDAPSNDPQFPLTGEFVANSNFSTAQSASLTNLSFNRRTGTVSTPIPLPSVAHRDRKINLNFPLPVSNRYDEPVRQKWIRETYQLLKAILPPKSTDTPEELAQLSQFVVNIVDFRDPDCTATRFVNTDLYYASAAKWDPATKTGTPAVLDFSPAGGVAAALLGAPWNTGTPAAPPPHSPLYDNVNSPYLVQYGMEYNPVAITEVLGFQQPVSAPPDLNRLFIELVNTLTKPGGGSTACDLELNGWDFIIRPDTPTGRPDPYTGQLPIQKLPNDPVVVPADPIRGVTLTNVALPASPGVMNTDPGGLSPRLRAVDPDGTPHPYVFQSSFPTGIVTGDVENIPVPIPAGVDTKTINLTTTNTPISASVLDNTVAGAPATENQYYWVYLRRPANPFDTTYDSSRPNENRVVVDCFRFVFNKAMTTPPPTAGDLYSTRRLQPFRGGHAVPPLPYTGVAGAPTNYCLTSYGFREQTSATKASQTVGADWHGKNGATDTTGSIRHTLGVLRRPDTDPSTPPDDSIPGDDWDFMPFNDRDFTSVTELLQVPACPPGLFTKLFIESAPPINGTMAYVTPPLPNPHSNRPDPSPFGNPITDAPQTFPYLADQFFYTAQPEPSRSLADNTQLGLAAGVYWPDPGVGPAPIRTTRPVPPLPANPANPATLFTQHAVYPYGTFPLKVGAATPTGTAPNQYYANSPNPLYIGGPSSAGWFKMFEFFDVPSPANGSIDSVANGSNYDWYRQDLKPGLLNLNLIIDEEVFFAVMSESWLKTLNFQPLATGAPFPFYSPAQADVDLMGNTRLNVNQLPLGGATPTIVTQVLANGTPVPATATTPPGFYSMTNQGFWALDPAEPVESYSNRMKAAFSDFLKLRHGGSGYMFAHQYGPVGSPNPVGPAPLKMTASTLIASERPFRSFSFPDVNYTLLRPAALPPSASTPLNPWMMAFKNWDERLKTFVTADSDPGGLPDWLPTFPTAVAKTPFKFYVGDPGVKNPYLFTSNSPVQPPAIPARRLFQVPDMFGNLNRTFTFNPMGAHTNQAFTPPGFPPNPGTAPFDEPNAVIPSNASSAESTFPPAWWTGANAATVQWITFTGDPNINWQNLSAFDYTPAVPVAKLAHPDVSLAAIPTTVTNGPPVGTPPDAIVPNYFLGANTTGTDPAVDLIDNRQHPAFRYDWLQKVTNQTTVRTHQYAVWITVGFFEVTKQGDPSLGSGANFKLAYDHLGQELNIQSGQNIRYRSFFIIDRTRAVGFSPQAPGNFRDCITYRQTIE